MRFKRMEVTQKVLNQVFNERIKQHAKFGEQNCPSLCQSILKGFRAAPYKMNKYYGLPDTNDYKRRVEFLMNKNQLTYADILMEEICEVVECMGDEEKMREELIQVAAVVVQWIEAIDRRLKK